MNRDNFTIPAHSAEAEASVLGALMLDNTSIHRVSQIAPESFYASFNADVFRAIQALAVAGKPFDVVTVYEQLQQAGKADRGDELARLNALAQYVPSAANLHRYAEILTEKQQSRGLAKAAAEIAELATGAGKPAEQIDAAQMILAKLATVKNKRDPQHINQSLADYLTLLTDLSEGKNPAISTGLQGLDRILNGGIRRGEMMVIGARPKHGKTALALALARNMARDYGVLFISQEMPVMQLMHRHTAAMGTVDLGRILRADATDQTMWERVTEAAEKLGRLNLVHDDQSAQSLMDIRRKAVQVKRQHGLDVLFVDFLQLMQGAGEDNRNRELDVISNGLKALALDLQIGVIVLSQMSRKADESYHHPTMTYLRDSGAIEAAADQIALLFTDHAHPMSAKTDNFKSFSQLEIVAHRNGGTGLVPLHFQGMYQQIGDWGGEIPTRSTKSTRGMD
ncbi:MAG: AAA family ATPase [Pseudomonadota bacterium]|nr:AAA family ATPase [Pseudomonadota bacterium]